MYEDRFWKKNWDQGIDDLDPNQFETTFVDIIEQVFKDVSDKTAMGFLGIDVSFGELNNYANQFANMLIENGFKKGDVVGINLPNIPPVCHQRYRNLAGGLYCIGCFSASLCGADQISAQ